MGEEGELQKLLAEILKTRYMKEKLGTYGKLGIERQRRTIREQSLMMVADSILPAGQLLGSFKCDTNLKHTRWPHHSILILTCNMVKDGT